MNNEPSAHTRVLVADDNIDALDSLAMMLELAGYAVRKCLNGVQAVQDALDWRPHFMLLDIGMPLLDGYEVARRIRAATWDEVPTLVAISGWSQPQDRERALAAGFDTHCAKPVSFDSLLQILSTDGARGA